MSDSIAGRVRKEVVQTDPWDVRLVQATARQRPRVMPEAPERLWPRLNFLHRFIRGMRLYLMS
jgi:hypothetical protein